MKSFEILLSSISDVKRFVSAAALADCEIDVISGRYVVDGKSILGLFSVDLAKPVRVEIHGTEAQAEALREKLLEFLVS